MRKHGIWFVSAVALASFALNIYWLMRTATSAVEVPAPREAAEKSRTSVELSEAKWSSANLHLVKVGSRPLQHLHTVPGKIDYNGLNRLELKAPVDATVQQVLVKPGHVVKPGTRLAVLHSPDIGLARADVARYASELRLAEQADDWSRQVSENVRELLKFLTGHPAPTAVEKAFEKKPLGEHRQSLLAAYSKFVLSEEMWQDLQPLITKGSVSAQVVKQRETNREVAKADFQAVQEQAQFDLTQRREKSRAARQYAEQVLAVSQQRLRTMLGMYSEISESSPGSDNPQALMQFFLTAPMGGTVEECVVGIGQRVPAGQLLYVVANTASLWVQAEIREHDWPALQMQEGTRLTVQIPALERQEFPAELNFVGRTVSHESQAVPLVGTLSNGRGLLKPGMFAWVVLPIGAAENHLAIPKDAILTHDNQKFVFVQSGPRVFRRVDIETGLEAGEWVAVTGGLQAGDHIVDRGMFVLKSELLLDREAD